MTIHYSCPWQHADTKQLLYKLSPATSASLELFIGATQNLVNLCCFIYKLSHWNIKTGLTLRLSLISFTLEPFSVDTQLQFLVNKVNVCLFFAFSHPSWQPLLIKNWNLKNRNQVATQYVKPLKSYINYSSFYTMYLVTTQDLERNVYLIVFVHEKLHFGI